MSEDLAFIPDFLCFLDLCFFFFFLEESLSSELEESEDSVLVLFFLDLCFFLFFFDDSLSEELAVSEDSLSLEEDSSFNDITFKPNLLSSLKLRALSQRLNGHLFSVTIWFNINISS